MNKEVIHYSYIHGVTIADENVPTSFHSHWHNSAEFTLIQKKGCHYIIGDEEYTPEPGDILMVWPSELHRIKFAPSNGYMLLQFSSNLIEYPTSCPHFTPIS